MDPELFMVNSMASIVVEFGYVTLFVMAFPLAPAMSYLNGLVSLRSSANVLMYRPAVKVNRRSPRRRGHNVDRSWRGS